MFALRAPLFLARNSEKGPANPKMDFPTVSSPHLSFIVSFRMSEDVSSAPESKRIRLDEIFRKDFGEEKPELCLESLFNRKNLSTNEEKELRKERGDLLLKLFKQYPLLANTASARKTECNIERAAMWDEIAEKVNGKFGERLEVLSVEKIKKLLTYYKKKDDGSYDNIKAKVDEGEEEETEDASPGGNDQLVQLLAMITSTPGWKTEQSQSQQSDKFYDAKRERHDYVVSLAESYMMKMSFDSSSRSAFVNAERHNMWTKVTMKANEKFGATLGPLGVEQAKKLYSNCKRRRKAKEIKHDSLNCLMTSEELEDPSQRDDSVKSGNSGDSVLTSVEEVLRGFQKSNEVGVLQKKLAEQEGVIQALKKAMIEQAEESRQRMNKLLDVMRNAVEQNYMQDVEAVFRLGNGSD